MDPRTKTTRVGVELLTLWMETGQAERWAAAEHIQQLVADPNEPDAEIIVGLLNLGMFLAITAAKAAGAPDHEMLDGARQIVRTISAGLPE